MSRMPGLTTRGLIGGGLATGALLLAAGGAYAQAELQCYEANPQMLIRAQPIYTGAPPRFIQSAYSGRWSEYESPEMKAKWTEYARVPTTAQLTAMQPAAGSPAPQPAVATAGTAPASGTWYVPASPAPGQPPQAYVPVQVQGQPQPLPAPASAAASPAPPPPATATQAMVPVTERQQVAALPPPGPAPHTNPDATTPPGAVGCNGERIDQTTAESARRAYAAVGFKNVRDLRKGCDNVWHAHAQLNGRTSYVMLNPQGDIYIEKNP